MALFFPHSPLDSTASSGQIRHIDNKLGQEPTKKHISWFEYKHIPMYKVCWKTIESTAMIGESKYSLISKPHFFPLCHRSCTNPNQAVRQIIFRGTSYVSPIARNRLLSNQTDMLFGGFYATVNSKIIQNTVVQGIELQGKRCGSRQRPLNIWGQWICGAPQMEACEYVGHPFYQGVNAIVITLLWLVGKIWPYIVLQKLDQLITIFIIH